MTQSSKDFKQSKKEVYAEFINIMAQSPNEFKDQVRRKKNHRALDILDEKTQTIIKKGTGSDYWSDHLAAIFAEQIISFNAMSICEAGFNGYNAIEDFFQYKIRVRECFKEYLAAKVKENNSRFICFQEMTPSEWKQTINGVENGGFTDQEFTDLVKEAFGTDYEQTSQLYWETEHKLMIAYNSNEVTLIKKKEVLPKLSNAAEEIKYIQVARFNDNALKEDFIVINVHIPFGKVNYLDTNVFYDKARDMPEFAKLFSQELIELNKVAYKALDEIELQSAKIKAIKDAKSAEYAAEKAKYLVARKNQIETRDKFVAVLDVEFSALLAKKEQEGKAGGPATDAVAFLAKNRVNPLTGLNDVRILLDHYKGLGLPVFVTGDFNKNTVPTNNEAGEFHGRHNANLAIGQLHHDDLLDSCDNLIENAAALDFVKRLNAHKVLTQAAAKASTVQTPVTSKDSKASVHAVSSFMFLASTVNAVESNPSMSEPKLELASCPRK